jgi:hypothetical protein
MRYVIVVDDSTKVGKGLLDIAKSLAKLYTSVTVKAEKSILPNAVTRQAILDAHQGKTENVSDINKFFESL